MNNLIELHFHLEDLFAGLEVAYSPISQIEMNPMPLVYSSVDACLHHEQCTQSNTTDGTTLAKGSGLEKLREQNVLRAA